jgi:hypothetical protein
MSKIRWAKWFWADWSNDSALNLCSIPARGLWMSLLCLAAQGDPYGTVTIKGRVPTDDELFDLTCPRATRRRDFNRWLAELEANGVAQRDHRSAIWSPRMSHFGAISLARMHSANDRWKTAEPRDRSADLHMQKRANGKDLHMQNTHFASHRIQKQNPESESPSPTPTPASGGGASHSEIVKAVGEAARRPPFRLVAGGAR